MNILRKFAFLIQRNVWQILLWIIAVFYLLLCPYFSYQFFVQEGKPFEVWEHPPEETGGIRYNIEDIKYWKKNMEVYEEGETYALWGWAFLDISKKVELDDFDRFIVLTNHVNSYVFTTEVFLRPGVQDVFNDLGLDDLTSSGIFAFISRNALPAGTYSVGLLFKQKQDGERYYIMSSKELVRTPNHLKLVTKESK